MTTSNPPWQKHEELPQLSCEQQGLSGKSIIVRQRCPRDNPAASCHLPTLDEWQSPPPAPPGKRSNCEAIGNKVDSSMYDFFYTIGTFCLYRPITTIVLCLVIATLHALGMSQLTTKNRPKKVRALCMLTLAQTLTITCITHCLSLASKAVAFPKHPSRCGTNAIPELLPPLIQIPKCHCHRQGGQRNHAYEGPTCGRHENALDDQIGSVHVQGQSLHLRQFLHLCCRPVCQIFSCHLQLPGCVCAEDVELQPGDDGGRQGHHGHPE